jgi:hypothetical protein
LEGIEKTNKTENTNTDIGYHGTPYNYDSFDASKIGTGEGASKRGKGIYFMRSKRLAPYFANINSEDAPIHIGKGKSKADKNKIDPRIFEVSGLDNLKLKKGSPRDVSNWASRQQEFVGQGFDGFETTSGEITVFPESIKKVKIDSKNTIGEFIGKNADIEFREWTTEQGKENKVVSESYHKAKSDESNPELVKAVESLLYKEQTPTASDVKGKTKEPLKINGQEIFYHGSNNKRQGRLKSSSAPQFGTGIYFTTSKGLAKSEFGENVTEVKLALDNPVYTNTKEWGKVEKLALEKANEKKERDEDGGIIDEEYDIYEINSDFISDAAKELGYDAIIDKDSSQYENEIIVLDESKIEYEEDFKAENKQPKTNEKSDQKTAKEGSTEGSVLEGLRDGGTQDEGGQESTELRTEEKVVKPDGTTTSQTPSSKIDEVFEQFDIVDDKSNSPSSRRDANRKMKELISSDPKIKLIFDNIKDINRQLEEQKLITKKGNCP